MALIKCPECGNTISDKASNCPKCGCPVSYAAYRKDITNGAPVQYPQKSNSNLWIYALLAFLLTVLLGGGAYWLFNHTGKKAGDNAPKTEVTNNAPSSSVTSVKQESSTTTSVKPETKPADAPQVVRNKVANGTYNLSGVIMHKQNYYFDMEVNVKGNQATGEYIVRNGENVNVTLSGSIGANGDMKLTEYKNGQPTGYYFTGCFNEATYSGTYRCTTRKLTMNFTASTY